MVTDEDNQKNAPLHMAVENRSFDVTKILLEKGNRCQASLSICLQHNVCALIIDTSRVPVEGKSSVCLICMKYRIIFLIIIIISLGQILLSYIANTSRTHERTHTHACARTHANACTHTPHASPSPYCYSMGMCQPTVTARSADDNSWSLAIEINTGTGGPVSPRLSVSSI